MKVLNCVMVGIATICLVGCGENRKSLLGDEYRFTDKDFAYENPTTEKFCVKGSNNDPFAEVVPNLRRIPDVLQDTPMLVQGFNPNQSHSIGSVYYCNPEGMGRCVIRHVGNGWVVAATCVTEMWGAFSGVIFVNPEETYIEGQALSLGFYVLKGTEKVSLANGSTKTMYAFVKLDEESNRLALEAKQHNDLVPRAVEEENYRRKVAREEAYQVEYIKMRNEFAVKLFKEYKFDISKSIHYPKSCKDHGIVGRIYGDCFRKEYHSTPRQEILDMVEKNNWEDFFSYFKISRDNKHLRPTESEAENDVKSVLLGRCYDNPWFEVEFVDATNTNCFEALNEDYAMICYSPTKNVWDSHLDWPEFVKLTNKGMSWKKADGVKLGFGNELYIYSRKDKKLDKIANARDFDAFEKLYKKHQQEY